MHLKPLICGGLPVSVTRPSPTSRSGPKSKGVAEKMTNTEQDVQYLGFPATFCLSFPVGGSLTRGLASSRPVITLALKGTGGIWESRISQPQHCQHLGWEEPLLCRLSRALQTTARHRCSQLPSRCREHRRPLTTDRLCCGQLSCALQTARHRCPPLPTRLLPPRSWWGGGVVKIATCWEAQI